MHAMLRSTLQRSINYYINTADDEPEEPFIDYINDIFLQEGDITEDDIKGKDVKIFSKLFGLRLKQHIKVKKIS